MITILVNQISKMNLGACIREVDDSITFLREIHRRMQKCNNCGNALNREAKILCHCATHGEQHSYLDTLHTCYGYAFLVILVLAYSDSNSNMLLDAGVDQENTFSDGNTMFYVVHLLLSDKTQANIVKRLLQCDIEINTFPSVGKNALMAIFPHMVHPDYLNESWGSTAMELYSAGSVIDYESVLRIFPGAERADHAEDITMDSKGNASLFSTLREIDNADTQELDSTGDSLDYESLFSIFSDTEEIDHEEDTQKLDSTGDSLDYDPVFSIFPDTEEIDHEEDIDATWNSEGDSARIKTNKYDTADGLQVCDSTVAEDTQYPDENDDSENDASDESEDSDDTESWMCTQMADLLLNVKMLTRREIVHPEYAVAHERVVPPGEFTVNPSSLLNMSRMAIRKNLQKVASNQNLREMVPQLSLPSILSRYMMFNVPCDE